jgi:hypothetical protein
MESGGQIKYGKGYKYQLREDWWVKTPIANQAARCEDPDSDRPWIKLDTSGRLTIRAGYCWDGPSGPTFDTPDFMRGSLAHDALYQLMRAGHLAQDARKAADQLLYDLCREDGMWWFRANYVRWAVRKFAADAARQQVPRDILAP